MPPTAAAAGDSGSLSVSQTTVLENGTILPGNYLAPWSGQLLASVYDPSNGMVYLLSGDQDLVVVLNTSAWNVAGWVDTPGNPLGLTYDPVQRQIDVISWDAYHSVGYLSAIDDSNESIVRQNGFGSNEGTLIASDGAGDHLFTACDGCGGAGGVSILTTNASSWQAIGASTPLPATPAAMLAIPEHDELLVSIPSSGKVLVFSTANASVPANQSAAAGSPLRLVSTVSVAGSPQGMVFDPEDGRVYITNSSDLITVINVTTDTIVGKVTSTGPATAIALDPLTDYLFAMGTNDEVGVIDGEDAGYLGNFTVAAGAAFGSVITRTDDLAVASDGGIVSEVVILNRTTVRQLNLADTDPSNIAFDPASSKLYVPDSGGVAVLNATNGAVVSQLAGLGLPTLAVYDGATDDMLLLNGSAIVEINSTTDSIVKTVAIPGVAPDAAVYDSASGEIFLIAGYNNVVWVLGGMNLTKFAGITGGAGPSALADAPALHRLFVVNQFSTNVEVINTSSETVVGNVSVGVAGGGADAAAYVPETEQVFVGNSNTGTVSIFNGSTDAVLSSVTVSSPQVALVNDPALGQLVALSGSDTGLLINASSDAYMETIRTGASDLAGAFDPVNDELYIANFGQGTVSTLALPLAVNSVTASPASFTLGNSTELLVSVPTGELNLSFSYAPMPPGCESVNSAAVACTPTKSGEFLVSAIASTGLGASGVASTIITVGALPLPLCSVTYLETGLAPGTGWGVILDASSFRSVNSSLTAVVPEGSYPYLIESVPGYSASQSNGSLSSTPTGLTISITFTPAASTGVSPPENSPPGSSDTVLILAAVATIALAGVVSLWVLRRRRGAPQPEHEPPARRQAP